MVTTTSYGIWNHYDIWNHVDRYNLTVEATITDAFGADGADGFDFEAIVSDYRTAINAALPPGVALCGNEFITDCVFDCDCDCDAAAGARDIKTIVDEVDLWEIIERHDSTNRFASPW